MMKLHKVTLAEILSCLPSRPKNANKTQFGRVKVWAGSHGYWGAGILCGRAAYRVGAGYVYWEQKSIHLKMLKFVPEIIIKSFELPTNNFVYAVGPGMGVNDFTKNKIRKLYKEKIERVVLDADALNAVAKYGLSVRPSWIMTPHQGELNRLNGEKSSTKVSDRTSSLLQAAKKYKCIILLKGNHSLIATNGRIFQIPTGNSSLAKAGTGDLLTGMISGFLAQGLNSLDAVKTSAYLHGLIADLFITEYDKSGFMPTDALLEIPFLIKKLKKT